MYVCGAWVCVCVRAYMYVCVCGAHEHNTVVKLIISLFLHPSPAIQGLWNQVPQRAKGVQGISFFNSHHLHIISQALSPLTSEAEPMARGAAILIY